MTIISTLKWRRHRTCLKNILLSFVSPAGPIFTSDSYVLYNIIIPSQFTAKASSCYWVQMSFEIQVVGPIFRSNFSVKKNIEKKIQIWVASV